MKTKRLNKKIILIASLLGLSSHAFSQINEKENTTDGSQESTDTYIETVTVFGDAESLKSIAGSANRVNEYELEKFEFDDIQQILSKVPGVNIRQEDGYGLRPNIGFRSATPERSKKINILEDGILIGPAPYSAPAAYYFPMMSRMSSVEVFKGPSAILFGPNTVVGTLNLLTRQVTQDNKGMFDLSFGSDGYQKAHIYNISNHGNWGLLFEGLKLKSDGFKTIDTGGGTVSDSSYSDNTGFDKKDITTKIRYNLENDDYRHIFELKLGYADEVSNETYLGLTDADFEQNPYRRYAASQLARMDWEHTQIQFNHFLEGDDFYLATRLYRNDFERAWRKLNNFNAPISLQNILQNPGDSDFYGILIGQRDSEELGGQSGQLLIGTNDREYYSQGIQSDLRWQFNWLGFSHDLKTGIRYHEDQVDRLHDEDNYMMRSSELILLDGTNEIRTANTENSKVWSVYAQDSIELGDWELTGGVRVELIDSFYQNNQVGQENDWIKKTNRIVLPGISSFYTIDEYSGAFAGIHRGFVPTSPQQDPELKFEDSYSFEAGYRFNKQMTKIELVSFFSDIDNLVETCTASVSSDCNNFNRIDESFNSGKVEVYGLESIIEKTFQVSDSIDLPISLTYTYTHAEFKEGFISDFALWGDVTAGDPVPYLPEQQLALDIGLDSGHWRTNILARYTGEMSEAAGKSNEQVQVELEGVTIEPQWVMDFSASYDFSEMGSLYFKIDNLLDKENLVSRRPFGARPGKPRQFFMGYKYYW